jgi:hypothetical protein
VIQNLDWMRDSATQAASTAVELATLAVVLLAIVAFMVGAVVVRQARRSLPRMGRHLEHRAVDAVLIWLGWSWLTGRRGSRARPAPPHPPVLEGDEIYKACPLSRWTGDRRACRWCNGLLPARAGRFCRPQCARAARENHEFGGAGGAREAALARDGYRCRWAGCGAGASHEHALEVHHITACHGRHGEPGCWHHLAGLVTLCYAHHQIETNAQRAAGEFGPALPRWTS